MDSVVGWVGDGFVIIAADSSVGRSIITYKHDEDKISLVGKNKLMAGAGPAADRVYFSEYISKNVALTEMRHGFPLDTASTAAYIRNQLAIALRKGPYQVNLLIGGFDATPKAADEGGDAATTAADGSATDSKDDVVAGEPSLYFCDYLASKQKMNFASHGYAGNFLYSLLDRHWKPKMSEAEAMKLMKACINQLKTRFLIHQPNFTIKIADAKGVRVMSMKAADC